jgi:hypothetical protein
MRSVDVFCALVDSLGAPLYSLILRFLFCSSVAFIHMFSQGPGLPRSNVGKGLWIKAAAGVR